MYSHASGLVIGFHGCDAAVGEKIIAGKDRLSPSHNEYDWLGPGIYFWENDPERALQYARHIEAHPERAEVKIKKPFVLGAIIDLGYCLNLVNSKSLEVVKQAYKMLHEASIKSGFVLPENKRPLREENDLLLRRLDCAVINVIHTFNKEHNITQYDSVRGVFFEGNDLYPNAGFKEKNHIQICVTNPNCIKGYFYPLDLIDGHTNP